MRGTGFTLVSYLQQVAATSHGQLLESQVTQFLSQLSEAETTKLSDHIGSTIDKLIQTPDTSQRAIGLASLNKGLIVNIHKELQGSKATQVIQVAQHPRLTFDQIYLGLAQQLAGRSHCVKLQVGAVLARDQRVISVGYNGPPAKTHNCDQEFADQGCPRDAKGGCSLAIHAEQNCIIYAMRHEQSLEGSTLYVTMSPCLSCARLIYQVGITKVIYQGSYAAYKGQGQEEGLEFLTKFGIQVEQMALTANPIIENLISKDKIT